MEKLRLKIGRISFSRKSGMTYITLIDNGKAIGRIILKKEFGRIHDAKEVAFFDGE